MLNEPAKVIRKSRHRHNHLLSQYGSKDKLEIQNLSCSFSSFSKLLQKATDSKVISQKHFEWENILLVANAMKY